MKEILCYPRPYQVVFPLIIVFSLFPIHSRVHISEPTYNCVKLDYDVEPGEGHTRNDFIKEQGVKTFLIVTRKNEDGDKTASSPSVVSLRL